MHRSEHPEGLSEIEIELRTRLWCSTVLWDWYPFEFQCIRPFTNKLQANVRMVVQTYDN